MTKILIHAPKTCGGTLSPNFNADNLPYLECEKCHHIIDDWIRWNQSYCKFFEEPIKWDDKKNHLVCLLGWFCHLYFKHYNMNYALSFHEKGLFQGTEISLLRRLVKMLDGDALLTKEYIEWIFSNKVIKRKKKITTLSFMCVADFIQEFKFAKRKAATIGRDTTLPPKMLDWVNHCIPNIHNYVSLKDFNDLNILLTHYRAGHLVEINEVSTLVDKLKEAKYVDDQNKLINWRD